MCFQIPKQVTSVDKSNAIVEGNLPVKLGTIKVSPGDYLLVYGNMAVEKIGKKKAEEFRRMISK
ncbi:HypC/HybG/HupF family hydrogenase formation chaperone [Candidatus Roizmanbacteria bacterium]|nr:HypC/HybG/HupF family hydrogenase formation chaperone [Candidatus Roizmanbacteria bacterium]